MAPAKAWVKWLWATGVLRDLPRVLSTEELKITVPDPEIETFSVEQVKMLLGAATDRTKLYILLGLNCGYTQQDISDLKPSQVDWEAGRITRKRSKTKTMRRVPTVSYSLWVPTLALLKQEMAPKGSDRVLLTENGGPLLSMRDAGGKTVKTDAVRLAFRRLKQKKKIDGGFKLLRKTAASMLADNEQFESLKDLFLGHAAASIADKHYARAAMHGSIRPWPGSGDSSASTPDTSIAVSVPWGSVPCSTPPPNYRGRRLARNHAVHGRVDVAYVHGQVAP